MLERVMIISGESSGELYGALLARTLISRHPGIRIVGVGGDRMEFAGVTLISRISSAFGAVEAVRAFRQLRETFQKVLSALRSFTPQVLVLIDFPDFNMRVARKAKDQGIKVLYYVSPQVWAWRKGRTKTIGRLTDKMAVILPFEEELYRREDVPCVFVGHPVLDEMREVVERLGFAIDDVGSRDVKTRMRRELGLNTDRPVMTLMPGSRHHEVAKLSPIMAEVIREMKRRYPEYQFMIPVAPNLDGQHFPLSSLLEAEGWGAVDCHLVKGRSVEALLCSDAAVVASGTSTLQAALAKVPMVVVYKLSPLTYFLGRIMVNVSSISLVNILLEKSLKPYSRLRVKELLQTDVNRENIMEELTRILGDGGFRNEMIAHLEMIRGLFLRRRASLQVSEMIESLSG